MVFSNQSKVMMLDGVSAIETEYETRSIAGSYRSGSRRNMHQDGGSGVNGGSSAVDGESSSGYPDDQSTSNGTPTISGTSERTYNVKSSPEVLAIAKRETRAVFYWRLAMIFILVASTVAVAVFVYMYTSGQQTAEYETAYMDDSIKVIESVGTQMDVKLGAVDAMSVTVVSYADSTGAEWPRVTVPDFAVRAAKVRSLTGAVAVQMYTVVDEEQKQSWELYTAQNDGWVQEDIDIQKEDVTFTGIKDLPDYVPNEVDKGIHYNYTSAVPTSDGLYTPSWQQYPIIPNEKGVYEFNDNGVENRYYGWAMEQALSTHSVVIGTAVNIVDPSNPDSPRDVQRFNDWASKLMLNNLADDDYTNDLDHTEPLSPFIYPVYATVTDAVKTFNVQWAQEVALVVSYFYWRDFLKDILPEGERGLVVVIGNACNQSFTYQVNGADPVYLGPGDLHDPAYDDTEIRYNLKELSAANSGKKGTYSGLRINGFCPYTITTYASTDMESEYKTSDSIYFTVAIVLVFVFTAMVFLAYDKLVENRQKKVMKSAQKSNAIVSSLFPSHIRDKLMEEGSTEGGSKDGSNYQSTKSKMKSFASDGQGGDIDKSKPIADLFPECTVFFADISRFTAWSSVRDPTQVFTLLETVYNAFDQIAARRGVFKVETIGDSYVAVVGLPEPRKDHAVVMSKFAKECREKFSELTKKLELTLGPETGDLALRIGIHSGAVTAGVLRGQKSRFQLFGDTVNTASRMESNGVVNKIQCSQSTADLIIAAEKGHWLNARSEKVEAKGKGSMQTYFVEPKSKAESVLSSPMETKDIPMAMTTSEVSIDHKTERLIDWNTDVLYRLLEKVEARRVSAAGLLLDGTRGGAMPALRAKWQEQTDGIVLNEVREVIKLPEFNSRCQHIDESAKLDPSLRASLREYVKEIALMYRGSNPFHNFEHASHVCMSVAKLLGRIVAPDQVVDQNKATGDEGAILSALHDHTYGITSDPLTQFACVFAALIHDVDHPGLPNTALFMEDPDLAMKYDSKSIAEQHSVNLAWSTLQGSKFEILRDAICQTAHEERRFRQLVINSVMATDIMDKDLKKLRDGRWKKAFASDDDSTALLIEDEDESVRVNRKATIVIEHLIQASDVAHTMQHWHVYKKWNEKLFMELSKAYKDGKADKDPAEFWYKGEIGFLDFYVIPLAKKLEQCGVFGVSSGEYLSYAIANRNEWEKQGEFVVQEYLQKRDGRPQRRSSVKA
mmetsp:Transcript_8004/g.20080  ORF Transcript_8004/g.20080 Transcript_8004/m.20080 type:complete len:1233 (+) Transcript_8004:204-3902(+)